MSASPRDAAEDSRQTARDVVRIAVPAITHSLLETLVFLVDRMMLGQHAAHSLAAMQICGPTVWSVSSVLGAFSVGTVALVGRATGAKDRTLATATLRASLALGLVAGALAATAGLVGMEGLLGLFPHAPPIVRDGARAYLTVIFPVMPVLMTVTVCASAMQAAGDARTPLVLAVLGNVVNAAVNWVLIYGHLGAPELGAQGAAIGSSLAIGIQAVGLLAVLARPSAPLTFRRAAGAKGWAKEREALQRLVHVSLPAFGEKCVQHAGFFTYVTMIGALGGVAMAANQSLISIESICFLSADGFGIAASAVVAQRLGAGMPAQAKAAARLSTLLAIGLLGVFALVFVSVPALLVAPFSPDPEVRAAALPCLYVAALAQPFMATGVVLGQGLRGAGATRITLGVSLLGGLVVRLLATWFFAFQLELGLIGVWLGSTCDWMVRTALLGFVFARGDWLRVRV